MMKRRILGLVLAVTLFASSVCTGYAAEEIVETEATQESVTLEEDGFQEIETKVTQLDAGEVTTELTLEETQTVEEDTIAEEEKVPVIIILEAESIIEDDAEAVMNFINKWKTALLEYGQDSVIKKIEKNVLEGEELDIEYQYTWLLNGIATEVPYGMIEEIEAIKGVEKVVIQTTYETCAATETDGAGQIDNVLASELAAYDGKGTKIAVIDTGIDVTHPSFEALGTDQLTEDSMTEEKLGDILPYLNAYQSYENAYEETIPLEEIYRSSKIPYGFDYIDTELGLGHEDYSAGDSDHGSHVAGIAAANDVESAPMCGVAPAAQIYVMKVFGSSGNATTASQLAAIEDAMLLGADVINMSLGSKSGFSSDEEYIDEVYERVSETGTILVVAAGNDGTADATNLSAGQYLASNPDNGTVGSPGTYVNALTVANADCTGEETAIYFSSSWGPSPDLKLEPDITAPGTTILSTTDNGTYGTKTGTSMATPYAAGIATCMVQQVRENTPDMAAADRFVFINRLLMSTAEPIAYEDDYWSPRSQGAGLINLEKALETNTYLSVSGMDVPKIELGDDPERTGSYQYKFEVNNLGDEAAYYEVDTCVQTEKIKEMNGLKFMSKAPIALEAEVQTEADGLIKTLDYTEDGITCTTDARYLYVKILGDEADQSTEAFRYDVDDNTVVNRDDVQKYLDALTEKADVDLEEETLKVEAGETETISVAINVTENGKAYMDTNFANGIYVEGYTFLNAQSENTVDLSLPYMGFYGDWTAAPILDDGYYWEEAEEAVASYTLNEICTQKNGYDYWQLGMNPYLDEKFDEKYISLSPNEDRNAESIESIKLSLLRNVNELSITFEGEDGQCYWEGSDEKIRKASFEKYYTYYPDYDMTDENGETLANNTKLSMKIELALDYEQEQATIWEVPITIDTEAPQILEEEDGPDITVLTDGTKQYIRVKVSDNVGVAAVCLLDKNETTFTKYASDHKKETAGEYQYFDITGIGNLFYVALGDYAFNQSLYKLETTGNDYKVSENTLYGYRVADEMSEAYECYGWIDINPENASVKNYITDSQQNLVAAEYIDGHVVGVDVDGNLVAFKFGEWDERKHISWIDGEITDMAYDPVTKSIYAYESCEYCFIKINPVTGEYEQISDSFVDTVVAMTCSDDGTLYAITGSGELKTVDKATGTLSEETLLDTGFTPNKTQSMMYDKEQNCIYWACHEYEWSYDSHSSCLIKIDLDQKFAMTNLGTLGGNAQVAGLMMLNDRGAGRFKSVELEEIGMEQYTYAILPGEKEVIEVLPIPWCASTEGLEWVSEDTDVAEITQDGVITGKNAGKTTIQIQKDGKVLAECFVKVIETKAELYGFTPSGEGALDNKWIKMNAQDRLPEVLAAGEKKEFDFVAAERVNDKIYGYDSAGTFYVMDTTSGEMQKLADASTLHEINEIEEITDIAYDYKNGVMYGIARDEYYTMDLVQINLTNGELSVVYEDAHDEDTYPASIQSIGISTDGVIYMISIAGNICIYDADSPKKVTQIGSLGSGFSSDMMSITMTYDHVNGGIYVVPRSWRKGLSLCYYEPESGRTINLGQISNLTELNGLHTVYQQATNTN